MCHFNHNIIARVSREERSVVVVFETMMATVRVEIDTFAKNDGRKISTDANATFVPNEKKKPEQIRATCGPHVGRRVRLKLAFEERENDEGEERRAIVRTSSVLRFIVANGVQIESEIKPKLPDAFDGGESFSRQFGTLKQHGVALQVRFKPIGHFDENDDDNVDEERKTKIIKKLTIGKANTLYEICDGAITVDKMSLAASITTSRIAEAAKPFANVNEETPRIGKSPEIWNLQKKNERDEDYDRKNPDKIRADQRGQERCEEIAKEYEEETRHWMGTNNHVSGQMKVMQDIDKKVAGLEGKLKAVTGFIVELEDLKEQGKYTEEGELVATPEMISKAEGEIKIIGSIAPVRSEIDDGDDDDDDNDDDNDEEKTYNGRKSRARNDDQQFNGNPLRSFSLSQLGVYIDECENQPVSRLKKILAKTRDSLQLAKQIQKCALRDAHLRHHWDLHESNVETRDVLENGVRREDMERLLGREATKQDVEASMRIPRRERARIVGGATKIAAGDDREFLDDQRKEKKTKMFVSSAPATKALPR